MGTSIVTYTQRRMVKALRMRTQDATHSRAGGALLSLARTSFSLIAGTNRAGWAVGVDGRQTTMLDTSPAGMLSLLSTNELVYACLRERMKVLIQPSFVVERRQPDGTYLVEDDHPLTALVRRPGPSLDTATLWRCLEASYSSTGRVYLEPLYTSRRGALAGLNPLNPAYIVEQYDGSGTLTSYDWQPPEGTAIRFMPDELLVRRAVDWAEPPPLIAALGAVEADQLSNEFMRGFFANAGVPSGIVKVKGSWSQELTDLFRTKWMERFGPGGMAQGGPAIFDENIDSYTRLGVSLNELDNETLRMFIETRICMCFGVPPLIIYAYAGLLKATYSNLTEAWNSFWDATALPLLAEWASWITWTLLTQYEDEDAVKAGQVRCRFDVSQVGPYQEDITAKVEMFRQGYDLGAVTMNELRGVMGMALHPDGDVFKAPPAPPIPYQLPPTNPQPAPTDAAFTGKTVQLTPPGMVVHMGIQHKAGVAHPEPPLRLDRDVTRYLRDEYAKARRLWLSGSDAGHAAVIAQIHEHLDDGIMLAGLLAPSERKAYADSWRAASRRVGGDVVIDSGDVSAAVDLLAHRVVGITETTRAEIERIILDGARDELSSADIAAQLAQLGIDRAPIRAPIITRTELAHAATIASVDAFTASGVVGSLTWLTGPDACDECQARDGQEYDLSSSLPDLPAHPLCRCDWAPNVLETMPALVESVPVPA